MVQATIKEEFKNKRLAFGKSANPLYKRSGIEINELAIIAHESKDKSLLQLFETFPTLAELKKTKTDQQLKEAVGAAVKKR